MSALAGILILVNVMSIGFGGFALSMTFMFR